MEMSVHRSFLIPVVSFLLGIVVTLVAIVGPLSSSAKSQRSKEAVSFFYRTMHALFEGTYDIEDDSVSPEVIETFKKYEARLGNKCRLCINDASPNYYQGTAFFPSGDCFYVKIERGKRLMIDVFYLQDWEVFWRDIVYRAKGTY